MPVVVLMNAKAGSGASEAASLRAEVERALAAAGIDASVRPTAGPKLAEAAAAAAREPAVTMVVAAGGDGTVGATANALAGTSTVLGVLPCGTFNHFARALGMPTDLGAAAEALSNGEAQRVDVAEVNGQVFVNNSVLGAYPSMVAIRDRLRSERGWGKVRAAPVAAWRVLRNLPVHRLDLASDGRVLGRHVRTPLLFVGNGVYANEGGGLGDRDSITDGRLGVAVAHAVSRRAIVGLAVRALVTGAEGVDELDQHEVPELVVASRSNHLLVALDGEIRRLSTPLRYRSRPGDLRVLVPADRAEG